jgi:RTX calcium-binding nonapeptide repeat (4 copies)/FG-GAP-like repeat
MAQGDNLTGTQAYDRINLNDGNDTAFGSLGGDEIHGGAGDDVLYAGLSSTDHDEFDFDLNLLFGEIGNDQLYGDRGDDYLGGGEGNDTLEGSHGNDTLEGGNGDDTLVGDEANDIANISLYTNTFVGLADLNNDNLVDLVIQRDFNDGSRHWQGNLSTGSYFQSADSWTDTITANVQVVGIEDVNGDGSADLVLQYDYQGSRRWQARLSNGESFETNGDWTSTTTSNVQVVGIEDVNGDGSADLVLQYDYQGSRRWQARLSNGESFEANGDWTSTTTSNVEVVGIEDVNGDGSADLVLQYDYQGSRR